MISRCNVNFPLSFPNHDTRWNECKRKDKGELFRLSYILFMKQADSRLSGVRMFYLSERIFDLSFLR